MYRIYLFFCLLCLPLLSKAQTFYEVNYTDDDGVEYLGLMIYYDTFSTLMFISKSSKSMLGPSLSSKIIWSASTEVAMSFP